MGAQWAAQWKVTSFTTDKTYTVSVAKTGRWACDCPAHKFARNPKPMCKHIIKVRGVEQFNAPVKMRPVAAHEVAPNESRIVASTPSMFVIQTRREICLE